MELKQIMHVILRDLLFPEVLQSSTSRKRNSYFIKRSTIWQAVQKPKLTLQWNTTRKSAAEFDGLAPAAKTGWWYVNAFKRESFRFKWRTIANDPRIKNIRLSSFLHQLPHIVLFDWSQRFLLYMNGCRFSQVLKEHCSVYGLRKKYNILTRKDFRTRYLKHLSTFWEKPCRN